jgi:hypothetical protein
MRQSATSTKGQVVVAGAGIGGLAAALGLARAGCAITVLEKTADFVEIGAGLQLGPNAFHALDYLGIADAVHEVAVYIDQLLLMDGLKGGGIAHIPTVSRFVNALAIPMQLYIAVTSTASCCAPVEKARSFGCAAMQRSPATIRKEVT